MSTLSIRLKRRARILVAGAALSAAALGISPSLAEAQSLGGVQNTNNADRTVGQVAVQNGLNSGANLNGSPNASLASTDSHQGSTNQQRVGGGFGSPQQNTNSASHTVGQIAAQDGANAGLNANVSPNGSILSPGSYQGSANQQMADAGYGSGRNANGADRTVGQVVLQDGVDLGTNVNGSPNVSILSSGSEQETESTQNVYGGSSGRNTNGADHTIGQVAVQEGVNLNSNTNATPNVSVLSPGSRQESASGQGIRASATNGAISNGDGAQNDNGSSHTVGQAVVQDGVNASINANVSPNIAVLSPGSEQNTDNAQNTSGNSGGGDNDNSANRTIGQTVGQGVLDPSTNINASPNVSILSPGSEQETNSEQATGGSGDGAQSTNDANHTIGQAVLQNGTDGSINANVSPNVSVLSSGSWQESTNQQASGSTGSQQADEGAENTSDASYTIGQGVLQNGANSNISVNGSPNVSVLSPGSYQVTENSQSVGDPTSGSATNGGPQNDNQADHSVGQIAVQNGANLNGNASLSPNISVLSPNSKQEASNQQRIGAGGSGGGRGQNTNGADHTIGQVVVQDGADLNSNLAGRPNISILSSNSEQASGNSQNVDSGSSGGGGNDNSADHTIGQVVLQDVSNHNNNADLSPNASILSPGSQQQTSNEQNIEGSSGEQNTNGADYTIGQVVMQGGADLDNNLNASPNASVLSPDASQETNNQQTIDGSGTDDNDNSAGDTIGQIVLQDVLVVNNNPNASPNVAILSPGTEQRTDNCQSIGSNHCAANTGGGGSDPGDGGGGALGDGGGNDSGNGGSDPGDGGSNPGDGSDDSDSSDDAGQGANLGPNDVTSNSSPTNRGPANGDAPIGGSVAGGDDRGSVGSSSTDAGSPAAADSSSAGTSDSVFLLMSDSAPTGAVPASMTDLGSGDEASSLASSEQGAAATLSADDTALPDTGGVDPWKAPVGFLLLSLGLLLVARRARRSPLTQ